MGGKPARRVANTTSVTSARTIEHSEHGDEVAYTTETRRTTRRSLPCRVGSGGMVSKYDHVAHSLPQCADDSSKLVWACLCAAIGVSVISVLRRPQLSPRLPARASAKSSLCMYVSDMECLRYRTFCELPSQIQHGDKVHDTPALHARTVVTDMAFLVVHYNSCTLNLLVKKGLST